jgi:Fur family peroxide stress response transcriptional regulator
MNSQPERSVEKLRQFEEVCRREGLPMTPQRRAVLEVLAARDDHPTAEEIYAAVKSRLPDVARATVYRVLGALVRLGVAARAFHPDATARFDPITERHHHLYCVACGALLDLTDVQHDELARLSTLVREHQVFDYSIYFRGLCAGCRAHGQSGAPVTPDARRRDRRRNDPSKPKQGDR